VRQLILDANLLVLLVVGARDRTLIARHKRTAGFTSEDYDLLLDCVEGFDRILVTPNILTEASNLLRQTGEPLSSKLTSDLGALVHGLEEEYVASVVAVEQGDYVRLGLTDSGLIECARDDVPLLTTDLDLYLAVIQKHPEAATNFNHLRRVFD
jgi:hypothetical protein